MIAALRAAGLSQNHALRLVGLNPGTYYRRMNPAPVKTSFIHQRHRHSDQRLSAQDTAIMHQQLQPHFTKGRPAAQCWAHAEDSVQGPGAVASLRTYQRYAQQHRSHRVPKGRAGRAKVAVHSITAAGPNQVWSWDITALLGPMTGELYYAYTVMDVFSRKVVAVAVHDRQSARHAVALFRAAITQHGAPGVVHSDNGATMRAGRLERMLHEQGVTLTFGRPRTSNDNAISESWFGTYKQRPSTPDYFPDQKTAQQHIKAFVQWYNTEHCHKGVGLFTPDSVFDGSWQVVHARRVQRHRDRWVAHRSRFGTRARPPQRPGVGRVVASRIRAPHPNTTNTPANAEPVK